MRRSGLLPLERCLNTNDRNYKPEPNEPLYYERQKSVLCLWHYFSFVRLISRSGLGNEDFDTQQLAHNHMITKSHHYKQGHTYIA